MRKSLQKLVLLGVSAATLGAASVNTIALASESSSVESSAESTSSEETSESTSEESSEDSAAESASEAVVAPEEAATEEAEVEPSALQKALEAALADFQAKYPDATLTGVNITESEVRAAAAVTDTVAVASDVDASSEASDESASDAEADSDESTTSESESTSEETPDNQPDHTQGTEDPVDAETTDEAATSEASVDDAAAATTVVAGVEVVYDIKVSGADLANQYDVTYNSETGEVVTDETTELTEADADGVFIDSKGFETTGFVDFDEVTAAALAKAGYGFATDYTLSRDDAEHTNPTWLVEVVEERDNDDARKASITIDAVTGEVVKAEGDVIEEAPVEETAPVVTETAPAVESEVTSEAASESTSEGEDASSESTDASTSEGESNPEASTPEESSEGESADGAN